MSPLVIGLDVSMTSTGLVSSTGRLVTITSKPGPATLVARTRRLVTLADEILVAVMDEGAPDLVVIEGPSYASQYGKAHERAGLWWLVLERLAVERLAVAEMAPTARMRYATGKGQAKKDAVVAAVTRRYPEFQVDSNDLADALVLCAAGRHHLGHCLAEVPKTHALAAEAVAWPSTEES